MRSSEDKDRTLVADLQASRPKRNMSTKFKLSSVNSKLGFCWSSDRSESSSTRLTSSIDLFNELTVSLLITSYEYEQTLTMDVVAKAKTD